MTLNLLLDIGASTPAARRCSAHSKLSACMGNALPHGARPRTKLSTGCSGTTEPDCTRRWPTSVRCGSKKTGWPGSPGRQVRSPAMGYGIQGQGHGRSARNRSSSPGWSAGRHLGVFLLFMSRAWGWTGHKAPVDPNLRRPEPSPWPSALMAAQAMP